MKFNLTKFTLQDKIMMGAERTSMVQTAQCCRNTAYHEAGHALVALNTRGGSQGLAIAFYGKLARHLALLTHTGQRPRLPCVSFRWPNLVRPASGCDASLPAVA